MAEIDALGIIDEIQSIVSDKLQVVSYKWLSRNYMVSSNAAKRLLEEFVEKYGNGIEVVYSLSGWLKKSSPPSYNIRLVAKDMLSDAKQEFDGNCSIHVYSVQACLPKDPATLWNHEFVQAEDLFRQPLMADNCLLDNRFGGVSNSFVKRSGEKIQVKTPVVSGFSRNLSARPTTPTQPKQKSSPNTRVQFADVAKAVKIEGQVTQDQEKVIQPVDKENIPKLSNNKKVQTNKSSSGAGTALPGMWGRASTKPKPDASSGKSDNSRQSSEARISAREAVEFGSSDDDGQDFHIKRTSNGEGSKKRRVVFDYSDEEDEFKDAVNLDSPDPPKKSVQYMKDGSNSKVLEHNLSFEKECDPKVEKLQEAGEKVNKPTVEKFSAKSKHDNAESSDSEKLNQEPEMNASIKHEVVDAQPKRRKVVKTRVDERGREVSEVVWEGEEPDTKSVANSINVSDKSTGNNAGNRPPVVKKSPAVGNTAPSNKPGKAGNKKAVNKDPKQGNILSFFKKA